MTDQQSPQLTTVKTFLDLCGMLDFDTAWHLLTEDFKFEILGTRPLSFNRQEFVSHFRQHIEPEFKPPAFEILDIFEERNPAKAQVGIVVNMMDSALHINGVEQRYESIRIFYVRGDRISHVKSQLDTQYHEAFEVEKLSK